MNLETLTTTELAAKYNEAAVTLGEKTIKRFSDKKAALRRTKEIIDRLPKEKKTRKPRGMRFVFPYHGDDNLRKIQRAESLRGRAAAALKKGATYQEIVELVNQFDKDRGSSPGNVERRAYELIRLLHYYVGYGMRQDDKGKIFIHTDEPAKR